MEIRGKNVLLLGGTGLVGLAVARELLPHGPASIVLCGKTKAEAEEAASTLAGEAAAVGVRLDVEWGDLFLPESMRERSRAEVIADPQFRAQLLDDLYGELTEEVLQRSALCVLLLRRKPHIIVDSINTATIFAYQNVFDSVAELRAAAATDGGASIEAVERHLTTLYLPQLIRHVQISLESMRRAGTSMYIKIGTAGTGGMGLNIPFTHSEERPSRALLAKASLAGAHTLLLYLMARTPDSPAVKEIKPTAAVSWKRIAYGEVRRGDRPVECYDATRALTLDAAFTPGIDVCAPTGEPLRGVFLDAGENGLFSRSEFETLTSLGLMEFITPEEIAQNVVREIRGYPTGRDVVAALDAATSGPTYRAGVMREVALERMEALEREHGVDSVAYEMLGPPRLSKLLFEGAILGRLFSRLPEVAALDPDDTAIRSEALLRENTDLRVRILSIGLPILLADGRRILRGPDVKVAPAPGQNCADPRLPENGWVDLRPANWRKWSTRVTEILKERESSGGPDAGSRFDLDAGSLDDAIRPGYLAAWVFRREDRGVRVKR